MNDYYFLEGEEFKKILQTLFILFKRQPGLCLQMSSIFLAFLKKEFPDYVFHVKTGNLKFKNDFIFKHEFNINDTNEQKELKLWDGHAWIEVNNDYIIDVSIFRTIYSNKFKRGCKQEVIEEFGFNRGAMIINKYTNSTSFYYEEKEILSNTIVNGIIKAVDNNKSLYFNQKTEGNSEKIKRNNLCPCGSGKKYKKCCLNNQ